MTEILIMMAALVAALVWVICLQRMLTATHRRLSKALQLLHSAKLTLTQTKEQNEALTAEVGILKQILFDVATGDADVWIEDGELRAARTPAGGTSVH